MLIFDLIYIEHAHFSFLNIARCIPNLSPFNSLITLFRNMKYKNNRIFVIDMLNCVFVYLNLTLFILHFYTTCFI